MSGNSPEDKMAEAVLEVYDPPSAGQSGPGTKQSDDIRFQFRPSELSLTKEVSWFRHNARSGPRTSVPQFTGSQPRILAMAVVLDEKDKQSRSVDQRVSRLLACCVPTEASLTADRPSPPWVTFRWGGFASVSFPAFLSAVKVKYTRFSTSGEPLRAVCEITLEEIGTTTKGQNPTSGSPSSRQSCVLVRGDSLQSVAVRSTGRAADWRDIARLNGVDDPSKVTPGRVLLLPGSDEL
ncbi:LysM peptidoglycan-binding domain-containing protein [Streptomyces sp. NPDC092307]|uniref:CIS tube protein n=1 Tax=Streptomyces sp. NPDC092307 TaxID=3366013 RepID=UPI0037F14237